MWYQMIWSPQFCYLHSKDTAYLKFTLLIYKFWSVLYDWFFYIVIYDDILDLHLMHYQHS